MCADRTKPSRIANRIERQLAMPGLVDALSSRLPASDLRSLLLEVYGARAAAVTETDILRNSARDPLFAPSAVSAATLMALDVSAFQAASGFTPLELSPVCSFAAASVLGGTSQNNILTTIRNAELLGDPTIALAIEAARRRRANDLVRLCASHRVIRLQPFDTPGFSPHFRLFTLVTAGRDSGSRQFEMTHLREHVGVYLRMFRAFAKAGFSLQSPRVEFSDMNAVEAALQQAGISRQDVRDSIRAHRPGGSERFLRERGIAALPEVAEPQLENEVFAPLRSEFPEADFRLNQQRLEGLGYYQPFAFRISPVAPDGRTYSIVDGGFTNWTARLLNNRKERLLISGVGTEFVYKKYLAEPQPSRNGE